MVMVMAMVMACWWWCVSAERVASEVRVDGMLKTFLPRLNCFCLCRIDMFGYVYSECLDNLVFSCA